MACALGGGIFLKLINAKQMMDAAAEKGYALPAINANGATYDLARAILEAADELRSPIIIQAYEPNLEYRGYDFFVTLVRHLAQDLDIPVCISLDHGKSLESVMHAVRAGFTHIMYDCAARPLEENIEQTNLAIELVRPLGISLEAEVGDFAVGKAAATSLLEEVKTFVARTGVDFMAVGVGTSHGIFERQDGIDFEYIKAARHKIDVPLVLHGTCGVSLSDISRCVACGMRKINFGEVVRMNYIRYFNELSGTMDHGHHVWKIDRAAKDLIKRDVMDIIRAVGSDGKI